MHRVNILLVGIVILGAFLRLYQFGSIPQGFQVDEASFGYNAYSIFKTGADEYGNLLPLTLRSFDDYKAALYSYIDIPFIAIFGLNEVAVRLPSAIIGIIFILLSYLLVLELTGKRSLSLIVALLIACSPTLIFQNRIQSDPAFSTFLVVLGIYVFIKWVKDHRLLFLLVFFSSCILSLFSYQTPRILLLLLLPLLFWHFKKEIQSKFKKILVIFYLIIFIFSVYLFVTGGARYKQTSVVNDPGIPLILNEALIEGRNSPLIINHIFHNKLVYYVRAMIDNYFAYLSFEFLFFQTTNPLRESVQNTGYTYLIELPFFLIGIFELIRKKIKWGLFIIGWVFITPLAIAPFILESPNIHRTLQFVFPLELISAYGIYQYFNLVKKNKSLFKASLILLPLLFIVSITYFLNNLFVHQPTHKPWNREHPYKQLIFDLKKYEKKYKEIIISTSGTNVYIYYLFFNRIDPKSYQMSGSHGNEPYNKIGKYTFKHVPCPIGTEVDGSVRGERNILYVNSGDCIPPKSDAKIVETIKWGDESPALRLIEYAP